MAAIANENIEKARTLLAEGRNKHASRALTDAAVACRDEETAREIKAIAEEGIQGAGFLGKSQWKEVPPAGCPSGRVTSGGCRIAAGPGRGLAGNRGDSPSWPAHAEQGCGLSSRAVMPRIVADP